MKRLIVFLLPFVLLSACSVLAHPTPTDSGIEGQALVGPMCPVVIEGQSCPDRPYQAMITVNNLEGKKIVQFQTDEQGNFHIPLAPGEYILHPESPENKPLPYAGEQQVIVKPGEFTKVTISYDSGIR